MGAFHHHALANIERRIKQREINSGTLWLTVIFVAAVFVAVALIVVLLIHFLGKG